MRILFIHEVDYENKPVFEMHELPELLALRGHEVSFLDFTEESSPIEKGFKSEVFMRTRVSSDARVRAFHQIPLAPGLLGRLIGAIAAFFRIRRAIEIAKPEVVVTFAVPTMGWQAALICRRSRIPMVYRALDVSHLIRKTRLSFLVKLSEAYLCRIASHVSANNAALLQHCESLARRSIEGTVDFPPLAIDKFKPEPRYSAALRPASIVYMGSFFYFSGLDRLLLHLAKLKDDGTTLTLIGGGEQDQVLRRIVDHTGLHRRVTFRGFVDFNELPEELSKHRVAINPMLSSDVSNLAFPNKVIQYMASGLPVVTTKLSGLIGTFGQDAPLAWTSSPEETLEVALEIVRDGDRCDQMSQDSFNLLGSRFEPKIAVAKFESMLERVRYAT